ncbi:hypothetical protein N7532_011568 [Penicillium argentinense]|uniref:N-acetyltransferase domain-containing protein n=1 Tax=Penicillium argentinense TaxID=1131581 RepID=A0A9W9EIU7_9EURO|nr:uncharacterized protein N7532_011568 [Penicillium argentinense]KAJ5082525.1 hypothetical protein N7532_011568 [Penicillium argentinense]
MAAPHHTSGLIVPVPQSARSQTDLDGIVNRYKDLRLLGLKVDPKAFSSIYEEESKFPYETWRSRVVNPIGRTFVALEPDTREGIKTENSEHLETASIDPPVQQLLEKEWLGIVTLVGPVPFSEQSESATTVHAKLHLAFIKDQTYQIPVSDSEEVDLKGVHAAYLLVGMFVLPKARRRGLAAQLVNTAIEHARCESREKKAYKTGISVQVSPSNIAAQGLYERMGFHLSEKAIVLNSRRGGTEHVVGLEMEIDLRET